MKVVIFIDWFAPAYKAGGPIQSVVNLVNQKADGIEYSIICSNKDLDGQLLSVNCDEWVRYNEWTRVWYNSNNKKIIGLLRQVSAWHADVFFINGIYSFYYNLLPILFGKANKKIISARGMLHTGALSQKSLKKNIYLKVWKLLKIHQRNRFHATNDEERNFIQTVFKKEARVHVVQNLPRKIGFLPLPAKEEGSLRLLSIGLISPMKNYLEVIRSLALCKENICYSIYGPVKDGVYWEKCKEQIAKLPPTIKVVYKGDLPSEEVPCVLAEAHVFILPSKSENFGHAIFEALAAGRPVITSHNTPWNGLEKAHAGFNADAESETELANAVSFFARSSASEFEKWSDGAKAYAEKAVDVSSITEKYNVMFSAT